MAAEIKDTKVQENDTKNVTKLTAKGLLKIAEVRMVLYIVPVALVILLIAVIVENLK